MSRSYLRLATQQRPVTEPDKKAGDRPPWHLTNRELKCDQTAVIHTGSRHPGGGVIIGVGAVIRLSAAIKNFPQAATYGAGRLLERND